VIKQAWIAPDGAECYHFCYHILVYGQCLDLQYFAACFRCHKGRQRRVTTKETDRKKAQGLADESENASRIRRSLRQAQAVLNRMHEELSGEKVVRTSLRQYLEDWFDAKKAETALSTMIFYHCSLSNNPMRSPSKTL
jgi:hypothetical protein